MQILKQMIGDGIAAMHSIASMIPEELLPVIAEDLGSNIGIAVNQAGGQLTPYAYRQMIDLSKPLLEPLHLEPWALQVKDGIGSDKDDFESFALALYGLVACAIDQKLSKEDEQRS